MAEQGSRWSVRRRALLRAGGAAAVGLGIAGSGPVGSALARPTSGRSRTGWIRSTIDHLTLEQKIGQLTINYVYGADADTPDARNTSRYGVATAAEVVQKYGLGGVIYFSWTDNTGDPAQIARLSNGLQRASLADDHGGNIRIPLIISADQETGLVSRIGPPATQFAGAMALGATRDATAAYDTYAITGREIAALGITCDHAPVADVNVNPANPVIGIRSFSSKPDLVSQLVTASVRGLQDSGVSATAKHFPGHGDTAKDSHESLPEIGHTRQEWEAIDAPPFAAAIEAGTDVIMTGHIAYPALDPSGDPATLSRPVLTGLLREFLGFDGVVITDALNMAAVRAMYTDDEIAVRVIEAGADILLMPVQPDLAVQGLVAAVESGRLSEERIDASLERVLGLKWDRGIVAEPEVDVDKVADVVGTPASLARAAEIAEASPTVLINDGGHLPLAEGSVLVTGWGLSSGAQVADGLAADGRTTEHYYTGSSPTASEIDTAVTKAGDHDLVVVLTYGVRSRPSMTEMVSALAETGRPVIAVALGEPYDIAYLTGMSAYVATYSYQELALDGLVRVLLGQAPATGQLPVDIVSATDSETIIYPYGSGLTL